MASPSVTYTFSNGTSSDASQVNQNFTDIINSLTDGTKDLAISALSLAGNLSVSGNTTIGSASNDDATFNASLASSIPVKTTATYDIGSATLGLRSIYFGANSQTVKIVASSSTSATYTFTLPVSAGTIGMFLRTNGSATTSWAFGESVTTKTTTYTATADETVILASSSGGPWTLTLPAAASFTNKDLLIKKTDSSLNAITIDGNGSETIDGATTTTLNTQYESVRIVCDGSNWFIMARHVPEIQASFTPTGTWTNGTYTGTWTRRRSKIIFNINFTANNTQTGNFSVTLPNSWTVDSTKYVSLVNSLTPVPGISVLQQGGQLYQCQMVLNSTTAIGLLYSNTLEQLASVSPTAPFTFQNTHVAQMEFELFITGMNG